MAAYATQKYFKLQNGILEAQKSGEYIFIVDVQAVLYIFDSSYGLITKMKLLKEGSGRHLFSKAFSVRGGFVAVPAKKTLLQARYSEEGKLKPFFKRELHEQDIELTRYSPDRKHLLCAGADGKAFLIDTKSKKIRYIFKNKPDFASCASFSHSGDCAVVSYFNMENLVLNLTNDKLKHFTLNGVVEAAVFFDDDKKILLMDREGYSSVYDCVLGKVTDSRVLFNQWVTEAVLTGDGRYVIVGTRKNRLYLLDPFQNRAVFSVDMEDEGVTSLSLDGEVLQLTYINGTIHTVDMGHKKDDFHVNVEVKDYARAKKILDENSFLYLDPGIEKFKAGFEDIYKKAQELIAKDRLEEALELVEPFMGFEEFQQSLDTLMLQKDHIAEFIEAVNEKKYPLAYQIAAKYPIIQKLNLYQKLERQWEKVFAKARKVLEEDPLRGKNA